MKKQLCIVILAVPFLLAVQGCKGINEPAKDAKIVVLVHWEASPIEGKKVEIVETAEIRFTDNTGFAEIAVLPGNYTVRIYEINQGGPCCAYVDLTVSVNAGETRALDVVDCLPCV